MAEHYKIEHVASAPRGWKVRTVTQGDHEVRIAFPPGRREKGSGHVVEILHPVHENPSYCPGRARMSNPAELVLMGANPLYSARKLEKMQRKGYFSGNEKLGRKLVRRARGGKKVWGDGTGSFISEKRKPGKKRGLLSRMFGNPSGEHFAIRWRTGAISNAYPTKAEAERVLGSFHGKGEIVRVNPLPLSRERYRNPGALEEMEAREIRTGFVDKESTRYRAMDQPGVPDGDYAKLGKLVSLTVKPTPSGETQEVQIIQLERRRITAISSTSRTQIYFAGGRQRLTSAELRLFNSQPGEEVELGECRAIVYVARKYHAEVDNQAAGKDADWHHLFGEETGVRPTLFYNTQYEHLLLRGGAYRVEDAGIVN